MVSKKRVKLTDFQVKNNQVYFIAFFIFSTKISNDHQNIFDSNAKAKSTEAI